MTVFLAYLPYMSRKNYIAMTIAMVGLIVAFYIFRQVYLASRRVDPSMKDHARRIRQTPLAPIEAVPADGWAKITGVVEAVDVDEAAALVQLTEHQKGYPVARGGTIWEIQRKELEAKPFAVRDDSGHAQVELSLSGPIKNDEHESSVIEAGGCVFLFSRVKGHLEGERHRQREQAIRAGDRVTIAGEPELLPGDGASGYREAAPAVPRFSAGGSTLFILHGSEGAFARAASGNIVRLSIAGVCVLLVCGVGAALVFAFA